MDANREYILKELLKDEEIKAFIEANNLDYDQIHHNLLTLYSFKMKKDLCKNCQGLNQCRQDVNGRKPFLTYNNIVSYDTALCSFHNKELENARKYVNLTTLACNLNEVSDSNLIINESRKQIIQKMVKIFNDYQKGIHPKGMYLYGKYGCGKSYIMACFANRYAMEGSKVIFAYFPDLVRELKSAIGTNTLEDYITALKACDVLFLDDIGGEQTSPFIRDEVLGAILQERMVNRKLTFFTSNLDHESLIEHLSESQKSVDEIRASRIMERIESLSEFYNLNDINYRKI